MNIYTKARECWGRFFQRAQPFQKADNENQDPYPVLWGNPPQKKEEKKKKKNKNIKIYEKHLQFFVNSFAYYGLTMNIGDLAADNVYLNFTVSGL